MFYLLHVVKEGVNELNKMSTYLRKMEPIKCFARLIHYYVDGWFKNTNHENIVDLRNPMRSTMTAVEFFDPNTCSIAEITKLFDWSVVRWENLNNGTVVMKDCRTC